MEPNFYIGEVEYSLCKEKFTYYIQARTYLEAENKIRSMYEENHLSTKYGELLICSIYPIEKSEYDQIMKLGQNPRR